MRRAKWLKMSDEMLYLGRGPQVIRECARSGLIVRHMVENLCLPVQQCGLQPKGIEVMQTGKSFSG